MTRALGLSVAASTQKSYLRAVRLFLRFRRDHRLGDVLPIPVQQLLHFCVHLHRRGLAPQSIRGHLSALAFWSKAQGVQDNTGDFRIKKVLEGWSRERGRLKDSRAPLSPNILKGLRAKWVDICISPYEALLFHAAALIAFFGALRIGELVLSSKHDRSNRALLYSNVSFVGQSVTLLIRSSKTDQRGKGSRIHLQPCLDLDICPVHALRLYIEARGSTPGPLFIHQSLLPLTKHQFWAVTSKALAVLGFANVRFATHSFRIGAASTAAAMGFQQEAIQSIGRWKSTVYRRYIRNFSC